MAKQEPEFLETALFGALVIVACILIAFFGFNVAQRILSGSFFDWWNTYVVLDVGILVVIVGICYGIGHMVMRK